MFTKNFCYDFFDILKCVFWAVGVSTPMSRSGFPNGGSTFNHNIYINFLKLYLIIICEAWRLSIPSGGGYVGGLDEVIIRTGDMECDENCYMWRNLYPPTQSYKLTISLVLVYMSLNSNNNSWLRPVCVRSKFSEECISSTRGHPRLARNPPRACSHE